MTIFEAVKARVTPTMAAERYGLQVGRNGMACCPFHPDRHPSMKFYDDHYHCFGCQANGDVVQLVALLLGLSNMEAARKLASDFAVANEKPSVLARLNRHKEQVNTERFCLRVLRDYLHILQNWKQRFAPKQRNDEVDPRYVEACHRLERTEYMLDLLTDGTPQQKEELLQELTTDNIIYRLQEQVKFAKEEMNEGK